MPASIGFISLGCAKNLVDSEVMIGCLQKAGMVMTPEPDLADVVIVNTCSFIDKAKQESIDTILGVAAARVRGEYPKHQKLIVAGCLAQRFAAELPELMPEVDAFMGLDQVPHIASIVERVLQGGLESRLLVDKKCTYIPEYDTPRYRLTPKHTAYIKIAEGCNHTCSFCAIPQIRGRHRSRAQESIVREAQMLISAGVREINLIAQDSTYFGMDRWVDARPNPRSGVDSSRGDSLASLLRALNALEGDFWIRILYAHPAHWSDELTQAIIDCPKVARYVDIPLQHISDKMLKFMQRMTDGAHVRHLLRKLREAVPDMAIRTTFISGFPGETEDDHQELLDFIEEMRFERAGLFTYSREEGTRAYTLPNQVPHKTKARRANEASELIARIAAEIGDAQIGKPVRVLVESAGVARSAWDAPEIDGSVTVPQELPVGEFATVVVTDAIAYDLVGSLS